MGARICTQISVPEPQEALHFHDQAKGEQVRLDAQGCTASRCATFHDGIVFSQRPVRPGKCVALRVLQREEGWYGGLRVGFTRLDPACISASNLPPFVCPDLVEQSPTWAAMLPEGSALVGDLIRFWVDHRGRLYAKINRSPRFLLRRDVLLGAPLWAVMDIYGTTKAIKMLDPTASWYPAAMPQAPWEKVLPEQAATQAEECVICFHHAVNSCLVPCGHTHFCSHCAWKVFRDTAKCPMCRWQIREVAPARAVPAPGTGEGS